MKAKQILSAIAFLIPIIFLSCSSNIRIVSVQESAPVFVNYDQSISQLVKEAKGADIEVDQEINDNNFSVAKKGKHKVRVYFVKLNRYATTDEAVKAIEKDGHYRPADVKEFVTFAKTYPSILKSRLPAVALGSTMLSSIPNSTLCYMPYMCNDGAFSHVDPYLLPLTDIIGWGSHVWFAVVSLK